MIVWRRGRSPTLCARGAALSPAWRTACSDRTRSSTSASGSISCGRYEERERIAAAMSDDEVYRIYGVLP